MMNLASNLSRVMKCCWWRPLFHNVQARTPLMNTYWLAGNSSIGVQRRCDQARDDENSACVHAHRNDCLANNPLRYSVCQRRTTHGSNMFSWWHNSWWNKDAHPHRSLLFLDDGVVLPRKGVRTIPNLGRALLGTLSRCAIFVTPAIVGVDNTIMCEHT